MGFGRVAVIDDDLGRSALGMVDRRGFDQLVSAVCTGSVGAIFCLEASRLARSNQDWHRLLELCAITSTLVIDEDGCYDPAEFNDGLVLGMKGTFALADPEQFAIPGTTVRPTRKAETQLLEALDYGVCAALSFE